MRRIPLARLAGTLGTLGVLALAAPVASQASFGPPYTTQCSGGEVSGIGTEVQSPIIETWRSEFQEEDTTSPLACPGRGLEVLYGAESNLQALEGFGAVSGARDPEGNFGAVEEPPTLSQWLEIDRGSDPGTNSGLIRQIPVASTAVAPLVNFPEGCAVPAKEATKDGRFTVSNKLLEEAYAGTIVTWGQLLPDIQGSCASLPIKRVVPSESEGTTFAFKQWLEKVEPKGGWEEPTLANTAWPNEGGATATVRSRGGDRGEAVAVATTNGAIGFSGLPSGREIGFGYFSSENPKHSAGDRKFWLSVENGSGTRVEPTRDPNSGADNVLGANCDNPQFNYTPSGYDTTVTPIWRYVSAAGSKTGWPICSLTYDLAWDDSSTVYGNTTENEAAQRTVKDYLGYVLGSAGQAEGEAADYSKLPSALLADAQEGQSRIGWNKTPGSKEPSIKTQIAAAATHIAP
jgi:ABC-type phosphate transport system substrate-binding protein